MDIATRIRQFGLEQVFRYLYADPEKALATLMDWADRFSKGEQEGPRKAVRQAVTDPAHPYYPYVRRMLTDIDPEVLKAVALSFFVDAGLIGWQKQEALRATCGHNVPWAILLDPTSACNLRCKGCWAAEYGHALSLSREEIDSIIRQGKELGVYLYIYTGGEPLTRKKDLLRLCEEHPDCAFLCFTNGTLIDEEFADGLLRVKNLIPALSLEGSESDTDGRRGEGVYRKVMEAAALLRRKKLPYGISACYTRANFDTIASEAFFDQMIDMGAWFVWYFHYMPVGNDALPDLLPTPGQRREMYRRIRQYRAEKPLFAMDFQNDAEFVGGCIAGGWRYLHINANGDVEPCVFVHYSDSNIREKTLVEALRSPMLMAYHDRQPFNGNMLRPCPMLENPEILGEMVRGSGARSTDLQSPETVEHLRSKCDGYAEAWRPVAEELWDGDQAS